MNLSSLSTQLTPVRPRYLNVLYNGRMNQRFWNGILATLLAPGIGVASSSYAAETPPTVNQESQLKQSSGQQAEKSVTVIPVSNPPRVQPSEVLKVGEYQSPVATEAEQAVIAKIHPYKFQGQQAATLYVRSIPLLTFLGTHNTASGGAKIGSTIDNNKGRQERSALTQHSKASLFPEDANKLEDDPVRRASVVAAKLNQLSRDSLDANAITVRWKAKCKCYVINAKFEELVEIDAKTVLADTTRSRATDALQATNRLRRLMGSAPPLLAIADMPVDKPKQTLLSTVSTVLYQLKGIASWYGEDSSTASGEPFHQYALTAAHRSLPFGTKVRVINLNNGRSVVVRINDRGPFVRGRVIDLSTGAARVLGMMTTGTAPVLIEVLGAQQRSILAQED
jgi:rare lipoprotein A